MGKKEIKSKCCNKYKKELPCKSCPLFIDYRRKVLEQLSQKEIKRLAKEIKANMNQE